MAIECELCFALYDLDEGFQFRCLHSVHKQCPFLHDINVGSENLFRAESCHNCVNICSDYLRRGACKSRSTCKYNHDLIACAISQNTGRSMKPWLLRKHLRYATALKDQINAFAGYLDHIQMVQYKHITSIRLCIERVVQTFWPHRSIILRGSRSSRLSVPESDIDLQILDSASAMPDEPEAELVMDRLGHKLRTLRHTHNVIALRHTSWPILRFDFQMPRERHAKVCDGSLIYSVDLSICSNEASSKCGESDALLQKLADEHNTFRPLLLVIKQLLRAQLSLSSVSMTLMVAAHVTFRFNRDYAKSLLDFFEFYSSFDYTKQVISMFRCFPITHHGRDVFIEHPVTLENCARQSRDQIKEMKLLFASILELLRNELLRLTDLPKIIADRSDNREVA